MCRRLARDTSLHAEKTSLRTNGLSDLGFPTACHFFRSASLSLSVEGQLAGLFRLALSGFEPQGLCTPL